MVQAAFKARSPENNAGVQAAFMQNHLGKVCIAFADPSYVRADALLVDHETRALHAVIHESSFFLGQVSERMANAFASCDEALLTSLRPDGTIYEAQAPIKGKRAA